MRKKQRPLFGVTEFYGDDVSTKRNYISGVYIQEEKGDFNRVLYGRNRLSKRILEKRKMKDTKRHSRKGNRRCADFLKEKLNIQTNSLKPLRKRNQSSNQRQSKVVKDV